MQDNPSDLFQQGKLEQAVQAVLARVKQKPSDVVARWQLAEFSCLAGDLERADRQFDTISNQDPSSAIVVALNRQLIRAETMRRECFFEGRSPELVNEPSDALENLLKTHVALRDENSQAARHALSSIEPPTLRWKVNDEIVTSIRDLDDLLCCVLEVHSSTGKYFWVEWHNIISLELHAPKRPLDLLWRRASLSVKDGPDGDVYLPAIYPENKDATEIDPSFRLGRSTDWIEPHEGLVRGRGQKILLAGESDIPVMKLSKIEVAAEVTQ